MSGQESYDEFMAYRAALPHTGMSAYARHLHRQLVGKPEGAGTPSEASDESRPKLCAVCRSLRRLNCTHVSAKRCARLSPASKRQGRLPSKAEDGDEDQLECYDFYSCGDVFVRGTYDELITDSNRPRFRGKARGDRRCADLCPLCWSEACWGDRGRQRDIRLTVRAPLRLRRQRLVRLGKLKKNEDGAAAPPDPNEDTSIRRRVRSQQELKKWRVRGLMKGKVQVVLDEELHVRRADKRYKGGYDLY
ncbi:hypothetical protein PG996_012655 [Apiospora saccharicola]|uniref:Uncharacterized protein n=1 Tax=Apiospora saccharicola TaxID=335842 RepID=A0ABR1U385_9PEZI